MKEKRESNVDIKGTIEKFIKADEPELTQEEAIMKYSEKKRRKKNGGDATGENTEEQEHLKRIKQEYICKEIRKKSKFAIKKNK